jgi:hypothetical protein
MAAAARTTKDIIQAYRAVRRLESLAQAKLTTLLETNALYKLFEPDTQHPYYALASAGENMLAAFERSIAGVREWMIGSGTIGEELDKVKARQIVNEEAEDADLDTLRLIQPVAMTEAEVADKLMSAYYSACAVWVKAKESVIKAELSDLYGKKNINLHREKPEVKLTKEANAAIRLILKTAKQLRDYGNGNSTIRVELEKKQVMRGLSGQAKDALIELMLKP